MYQKDKNEGALPDSKLFSLLCCVGCSMYFADAGHHNTNIIFDNKNCNRGCNSGSLLELYSKTSIEFSAVRENYRNKTISPKHPLLAVTIQQYF